MSDPLFGVILKSIGILLAFVLFFYIILKFFHKKKVIFTGRGGPNISLLTTLPIGRDKYIQLIDIKDRILVVGVWGSGMRTLAEITSKEEVESLRSGLNQGLEFADYFPRNIINFFRKKEEPFLRRQVKRLEALKEAE